MRVPQRDRALELVVVVLRAVHLAVAGRVAHRARRRGSSVGVKPRSIAAVYTIGLNVDPIWRYACTARLNLLRLKLQPPTIALIWPVWLSIASSAPSTSGVWSSVTVAAPRRVIELRDGHLDQIARLEEVRGRGPARPREALAAEVRVIPADPQPCAAPVFGAVTTTAGTMSPDGDRPCSSARP